MAAQVKRLVPRGERLGRDAALAAKAALVGLPADVVPSWALRPALDAVERATERYQDGDPFGVFSMLSRAMVKGVRRVIRSLPAKDRPGLVREAFDEICLQLDPDTGRVMLTRDQLAEELGCSVNAVSDVMGVLRRLGVVEVEYHKVPGMRGRGIATWFFNPHVAWNGSLDVRREVAARTPAGPLLRLMESAS